MKNKIKNVLAFLLIFISIFLIIGTLYYIKKFEEVDFGTLLYNVKNGVENANIEIIGIAIKQNILKIIFWMFIAYLPIFNYKKRCIIEIQIKKRKKAFKIWPFNKKIYILILICISVFLFILEIGILDYLREQTETTHLFDDYYVDSSNVAITFPEQKRNLIIVFLESMETSLMSQEEGGGWKYSVIPELEQLAKENINFSNTSLIGGAGYAGGTGWTAAGMIAQTSGTPLKVGGDANSSQEEPFLPGLQALGDILKNEGYNLEVMFGSDASFGDRSNYFTTHGNYKIFDINTAIEQGKMTEEDKVWWGFDDDDLFNWSKEEILNLASQDKPFNYIMLTADTHFVDGYLSENVENKYDSQYENVYAYSSKSVYKFIQWIKEQSFYNNTTIVLIGDHLGMQTEFYKDHMNENYNRTIYNAFINSAIEDSNSKNRQFSPLDIYPTVLASMGVKIDGDRLGLGTNLYSGKKTLVEELGFNVFNEEIVKKSNYYNSYLLKKDYLEIVENEN